jgi:hypothetical protein
MYTHCSEWAGIRRYTIPNFFLFLNFIRALINVSIYLFPFFFVSLLSTPEFLNFHFEHCSDVMLSRRLSLIVISGCQHCCKLVKNRQHFGDHICPHHQASAPGQPHMWGVLDDRYLPKQHQMVFSMETIVFLRDELENCTTLK